MWKTGGKLKIITAKKLIIPYFINIFIVNNLIFKYPQRYEHIHIIRNNNNNLHNINVNFYVSSYSL